MRNASIRLLFAAAAVAALSGCKPVPAEAQAKKGGVDPQYAGAIGGTFRMPKGHTSQGVKVVFCPEPYDQCDRDGVEQMAMRQIEADANDKEHDARDGFFLLKDLDPKKKYQVAVWKDVNGNGEADDGDVLGVADGGKGFAPPAVINDISTAVRGAYGSAGASSEDDAPMGGAVPTALAGRWVAKASGDTQLQMSPTIKFQPGIATGGGFNLGATMGPGGATNTVIVNEFKPVKGGDRRQSIEIRPDGSFTWIVDRGAPWGSSCVEQVHEERLGSARIKGDKIFLSITGGFTTLTNPCGYASTRNRRDPFPARMEDYTFTKRGSSLNLVGTGGVNWTFQKG